MLPADISSHDPREKPSYGAAFSGALINPERATPDCVAGPNGKTATKRYNVYRNNVTVSLIEALASIYPAGPASPARSSSGLWRAAQTARLLRCFSNMAATFPISSSDTVRAIGAVAGRRGSDRASMA
jgi:hypothetical protein